MAPDLTYLVCHNFWRTDWILVLVKTAVEPNALGKLDTAELEDLVERTRFRTRFSGSGYAFAQVQLDENGNQVDEIKWLSKPEQRHPGLTAGPVLVMAFFMMMGSLIMSFFYRPEEPDWKSVVGSVLIGFGLLLLFCLWPEWRGKRPPQK